MSNNIISFSLWGTNFKYLVGAIRNAKLAQEIYPGWKCRFYCDSLVPNSIKYELEDFGAEIIEKNVIGDFRGMFWRFEAVNEEDMVLIRDCDSRLGMREKYCVDEWIKSGMLYHTIKDHPYHNFKVMPGLMGFKKSKLDIFSLINSFDKGDYYGVDYGFFDAIWDYIKDDMLVHDDFFGGEKINFKRNGFEFIGEIYDEKERVVKEHRGVLINFVNSKMNTLYIHHHLGLGDHLDCNALVRIFLKKRGYDRVYVFAKAKYSKMIKYMYRDEPNIYVLEIPGENEYLEIKEFIDENKIKNFLSVGHENYPWGKERDLNKACAEIFYDLVGIDFERRFKDFYFERDYEEEERVFNKLNPLNEDYIFVHDDTDRGFAIKDEKVYNLYGKKIKIIRNDITENIFHFFKILENAKQIHLMESSFKSIVEILNIEKECYFHNFRSGASSLLGKTRQKWIEVKYE